MECSLQKVKINFKKIKAKTTFKTAECQFAVHASELFPTSFWNITSEMIWEKKTVQLDAYRWIHISIGKTQASIAYCTVQEVY